VDYANNAERRWLGDAASYRLASRVCGQLYGTHLWCTEEEYNIAGFRWIGDVDYCEGSYVEDFPDAGEVSVGQAVDWWDGGILQEVPKTK
jgi:hypothetical protein